MPFICEWNSMYAHLPWVLGTNCTLFAGPIPLFVALSLDSALEICWRILELGGLTAPIFTVSWAIAVFPTSVLVTSSLR